MRSYGIILLYDNIIPANNVNDSHSLWVVVSQTDSNIATDNHAVMEKYVIGEWKPTKNIYDDKYWWGS